jgi:hypothetical protein
VGRECQSTRTHDTREELALLGVPQSAPTAAAHHRPFILLGRAATANAIF